MTTSKLSMWRKRAAVVGAAVGLIAVSAFGAFLGASSVAAYLGSSGGTVTIIHGGGQGAMGIDHNKLVVFASEDTGYSPSKISGTVSYQADNAVSVFTIDRAKFSVRDTASPMNPWTVISDEMVPSSKIVNGTPINTFQDTFLIDDLNRFEFKIEIWDDATDANPEIVMAGEAKGN